MCLCSQWVSVCVCVCVEAAMCAVMHGPFFLRAGHLIISQSPGLMETGERWELYLPAEKETEGDGCCVLMQAGLLFSLAWPPNTWDQGHCSTVDHSWHTPHCYWEHIHSELWPRHRPWQRWEKKCCSIIHHICRKVSRYELCLRSQKAPITLWYINKLTST